MKKRLKFLLKIKNYLLLFFLLIGCDSKFDEVEFDSKSEQSRDSIYADFEPLWNLYLESSNGGWKNNDLGRFSNDDAPVIEALLELYKLTNDVRYLDKLNLLVENILNNDDVSRQLRDSHRGNKILPGWSSLRYTDDSSRTIFLMDDALILIPIIKSYDFIKNETNVIPSKIDWLERAEHEFDLVFKDDWKYIDNDKGYFQDSYYSKKDLNMPMNQYAITGELCLNLFNTTKKNLYKEYAIKTANFLKTELIRKDDGFVWYYKKPSKTYPTKQYDDFSHSQLVWRFIHSMYQQNLVFNDDDIEMFKGTFKNKVMSNDKVFYFFEGMINESTPAPENLIYKENPWLQYYYSLAMYDSEIKKTLKVIRKNGILDYNPNSDFNHIGLFAILDFALAKKYLN